MRRQLVCVLLNDAPISASAKNRLVVVCVPVCRHGGGTSLMDLLAISEGRGISRHLVAGPSTCLAYRQKHCDSAPLQGQCLGCVQPQAILRWNSASCLIRTNLAVGRPGPLPKLTREGGPRWLRGADGQGLRWGHGETDAGRSRAQSETTGATGRPPPHPDDSLLLIILS